MWDNSKVYFKLQLTKGWSFFSSLQLMADMRLAAQEDRDLNQKGSPAIKKLSMMPAVRSSLGKTYEFEDCL